MSLLPNLGRCHLRRSGSAENTFPVTTRISPPATSGRRRGASCRETVPAPATAIILREVAPAGYFFSRDQTGANESFETRRIERKLRGNVRTDVHPRTALIGRGEGGFGVGPELAGSLLGGGVFAVEGGGEQRH